MEDVRVRALFSWIKWVPKGVKDFLAFLLKGFSPVDMIEGITHSLTMIWEHLC